MNRYLARWNKMLAPLAWEDLPFTDCDQAAFVLCELRTDPGWLKSLLSVFPSGGELYVRLRYQIGRTPAGAPGQTEERAPAMDEQLVRLAQHAAAKITELTGESFSAAQPVVLRDAPAAGEKPIEYEWGPISERLGDMLIDIGCDAAPEVSEAIDLLRECLYRLEYTYDLADHVLWPYYASALTGADPYEDLLALGIAGVNYVGADSDGRLGLIMKSALGQA